MKPRKIDIFKHSKSQLQKKIIEFKNYSTANKFAKELRFISSAGISEIKVLKKLSLGEGEFPKCKLDSFYYVEFESIISEKDRQVKQKLSKLISKYYNNIIYAWIEFYSA